MIIQYFKKNRQHFFPEIVDWKDPQDQWRQEKDVSKLNFAQWFFCHPSAYKLMHYGIPCIGTATFGLATAILHMLQLRFWMGLLAFMTLTQIYLLIKRLKNRKYINTTKITYYDLWMRDYPKEEDYI